ncbi:rhodanese-like domain-containing protein [Xanthomonadaceae bacterium JHOS43]|nr:rhodanese-like domain-containing protein [Xanthomonadaceae bacterium JHOS43]MCX7563635.1 rhodanese-like domain-containing protein [Xanthomonadaceae bacterium XH05]
MTLTANDLVADAHVRIKQVSATQLKASDDPARVLIDVREPGEYAEGHLPGAINLPRGVLEFKIEAHPALACASSPALADRQRSIVLYCLSGGRSALAADSLQRLGFQDVRSLTGGITAWRDAGLAMTTE